MGGFDIYCAFCGGPFNVNGWFDEENEGMAYDPTVLSEEDLDWIEMFRLIGRNPDSFALGKTFITGPARAEEYGSVECMIGNDPNVPHAEGETNIHISAYVSSYPDDEFSAPFHDACYQVLVQALRYHLSRRVKGSVEWGEVDKEVLYEVIKGKSDDQRMTMLNLDYGENQVVHEQYWFCVKGEEAWVSNPSQSDKISAFFDGLENMEVATNASPPISTAYPTSSLAKLADELIYEILLHLPFQDLKSFARSGVTALQLSHHPAFWNRKIFIDMPWLWDLPSLEGPRDFFGLYKELHRQCFATSVPQPEEDDNEDEEGDSPTRVMQPRDQTLVLGLANRRRIWNTCTPIASAYAKSIKEAGISQGATPLSEIAKNSITSKVPIVTNPISREAKALSTFFLTDLEEVDVPSTLFFYFRDDGRLCGVDIDFEGIEDKEKKFGVIGIGREVTVDVPEKAWIVGFEVTLGGAGDIGGKAEIGIIGVKVFLGNGAEKVVGSEEGDKRIFMVSQGHILSGLVGEMGNEIIQRFGLLQYPATLTTAKFLPYNTSLTKHLWKSSLPPSHLSASLYETGYWSLPRPFDTIQMQALIFGNTEKELEGVVGFVSDETIGGFGILLAGGEERTVGWPPKAEGGGEEVERKVFEIDGPGGERIIKVEVGMNHAPMAVKITTNRNRIAFFGACQKNYHMAYEPTEDSFLAGIYASFSRPDCTTFSILSGSKTGGEAVEVVGTRVAIVFTPPRPNGQRGGIIYTGEEYAAVVEQEEGERLRETQRIW